MNAPSQPPIPITRPLLCLTLRSRSTPVITFRHFVGPDVLYGASITLPHPSTAVYYVSGYGRVWPRLFLGIGGVTWISHPARANLLMATLPRKKGEQWIACLPDLGWREVSRDEAAAWPAHAAPGWEGTA